MIEEIICFDPRDHSQKEEDANTWKPTRNLALIAAQGAAGNGYSRMFWDNLKAAADYCDALEDDPKCRTDNDLTPTEDDILSNLREIIGTKLD